jgi:hypothetical protein
VASYDDTTWQIREIARQAMQAAMERLSKMRVFRGGAATGVTGEDGEPQPPRQSDGLTPWRAIGHPNKREPEPVGAQPCTKCGLLVMVWKLTDGTFVEAMPDPVMEAPWLRPHRCASWFNHPDDRHVL